MIYQQPECVSNDNPFTISDLLNVEQDFPESPYVYFGNSDHSVICVVSPFNPADQWCSAKAPDWSPPPFTGFSSSHVSTPPPGNWQPPVVTPEPAYLGVMLAILFLAVLTKARRWCGR